MATRLFHELILPLQSTLPVPYSCCLDRAASCASNRDGNRKGLGRRDGDRFECNFPWLNGLGCAQVRFRRDEMHGLSHIGRMQLKEAACHAAVELEAKGLTHEQTCSSKPSWATHIGER